MYYFYTDFKIVSVLSFGKFPDVKMCISLCLQLWIFLSIAHENVMTQTSKYEKLSLKG